MPDRQVGAPYVFWFFYYASRWRRQRFRPQVHASASRRVK